MANNYTAVPHAYLEECEALTDAEFGALIRGLLRYSMTGEAIELEGNARFFARRVMNQEDVNAGRYDEIREKRREAGRRGAMARWQTEANASFANGTDGKNGRTEQNSTDTETDTETEDITGE